MNEVLFPMVHNAMSSYDDYFLAANNKQPLEQALVAGYRGLMLDSCLCDGGLKKYLQDEIVDLAAEVGVMDGSGGEEVAILGFCHTYCDAGVRDPAIVLNHIKQFMETNANEVSSLCLESR